MMTTSDAVQVAAASNSISAGDVAAAESPSTRIAGRPVPLPSNWRCLSQRVVTSAVLAISVPPPCRQTDVQPVPAHPVHAVIFDEPVERGAIPQLESEDGVEPQARTPRIGTGPVTTRDASPSADVAPGHLFARGAASAHFAP